MIFAKDADLHLPQSSPPVLAVVVDTEEEFPWDQPFDAGRTSVANLLHQHLAQAVLDRYGVVPTYVVDYPVATDPRGIETLGPWAAAGRCHIGTHLHPWVNPPHQGPVDERHSYPGNLPPDLERAKLQALTDAITQSFGQRPVVYKAGRYGVGPATSDILSALGYRYDVSIVPHTDFSPQLGPDFRDSRAIPFRFHDNLVAIPHSVEFVGLLGPIGRYVHPVVSGGLGHALFLDGIASRMGLLERLRLTPEGHGIEDLVRLTRAALARGRQTLMLTYHSSSLLPGATSYVRDNAERRQFLDTVDRFLDFFFRECGGISLPVATLGARLHPPPAT